LLEALAEAWKPVQHGLQVPDAVGVMVAADDQVLADGHIGKDHLAFGHQHRRVADAAPGRLAGGGPPVNEHLARPGWQQADDRLEQGGLAGAIGPEQADDLAVANVQAGAVNHLEAAIAAA